jgi:hypothetical protein
MSYPLVYNIFILDSLIFYFLMLFVCTLIEWKIFYFILLNLKLFCGRNASWSLVSAGTAVSISQANAAIFAYFK